MVYLFVFVVVIVIIVVVVRSVRSAAQDTGGFQDAFGDAPGSRYRCMICDSEENRFSDYDERCPSCGYSTKRIYRGVLKDRINLISDVNSAMSYFNEAIYRMTRVSRNNQPDWSGYLSAVEQGTALIYGGFSKAIPLAEALRAVGEPEFAGAVEQMKTAPGDMASRAERHLALLKLAKTALAKDVQRRLKSEGAVHKVKTGQPPSEPGPPPSPKRTVPKKDATSGKKAAPARKGNAATEAVASAPPPIPTHQKTTPPPVPAAPRRDDAKSFVQAIFGEDDSSVDAENRFADHKGQAVKWQGTLLSATPFTFDFDFDEAPGVKAEVLLQEIARSAGLVDRYVAAVRFAPEAIEPLRAALNRPIVFSGELLKLNASGRKMFVKTGKLLRKR